MHFYPFRLNLVIWAQKLEKTCLDVFIGLTIWPYQSSMFSLFIGVDGNPFVLQTIVVYDVDVHDSSF